MTFQNTNALTASSFFVAAIVADAMTARETAVDAPASLRGTGLVLAALFAAPAIKRPSIGIYGWLQRPVVFATLFVFSLLGLHVGGPMMRAFDALFVTIVGFAMIGLYYLGGIDDATKTQRAGKMQESTSSCMLAGGMLLYSNIRIMRAGLAHPSETRNFGVPATNTTTFVRGYAHASDLATIASSFGGALGIGAAVTMIVHVQKLANGTGKVSLQLGVAGVFQLLSAFVASLSMASQIMELNVVFSQTACRDASFYCRAAAMSRRFATTNTPSAGLWLSGVGLLALAYPPSVRLMKPSNWGWTESTDEATALRRTWMLSGGVFSFAAGLVAFVVIFANSRFVENADFVLLLSLVSVFWSSFLDTWSGSLLYLVSFLWQEIEYLNTYGVSTALSHLTHVSLYFNALLLATHMTLVFAALFCPGERLARVTGGVAIAGASIAMGLFTASTCLTMGSGGDYSVIVDISNGPVVAAEFVNQHYVPVLVWAPLFTCRCEPNLVTRSVRATAWLLSAPLVLVVYTIVLASLQIGPPSVTLFAPYGMFGSIVGAGVLPWAAAAFV